MYKFTFKNGDELELKGIKHAAFASQETHCYEANVYFKVRRLVLYPMKVTVGVMISHLVVA